MTTNPNYRGSYPDGGQSEYSEHILKPAFIHMVNYYFGALERDGLVLDVENRPIVEKELNLYFVGARVRIAQKAAGEIAEVSSWLEVLDYGADTTATRMLMLAESTDDNALGAPYVIEESRFKSGEVKVVDIEFADQPEPQTA